MKHLLTIAALALSVSCAGQTQEQETTNTEYPMNQTTLTLNNGGVIPQFGLGVYSIPAGETTYNSGFLSTSRAKHNASGGPKFGPSLAFLAIL